MYSKDKQLGKWDQHFCILCYKQNIVTNTALKHMEIPPTIDDLDSKQTIKELSKAINKMASWKAPGSDGIPADLFG